MNNDSMDWRTPDFRAIVLKNLEETAHQYGYKGNKPISDMEKQMCAQAQSRKQYFDNIARLIMHIKDPNKKPSDAQIAQLSAAQDRAMFANYQNRPLLNSTLHPRLMTVLSGPHPTQAVGPSPPQMVPSPRHFAAPFPGAANTNVSPASRSASEEQLYMDKWKQLQKFKEPLRRMLMRIENDGEHKGKMVNLLDVLSDPKKRLSLATLYKCEAVLVKLDLSIKPAHMCQPLLDVISANLTSPLLNHGLSRTFGPIMQTLQRGDIDKGMTTSQTTDSKSLADELVLKREIERSPSRFVIKDDHNQYAVSSSKHFICHLDDIDLPKIPPIFVSIPHDYPAKSPACEMENPLYSTSSFLQKVQSTFLHQVAQLPEVYSLSMLLDSWEMSVRLACGSGFINMKPWIHVQ